MLKIHIIVTDVILKKINHAVVRRTVSESRFLEIITDRKLEHEISKIDVKNIDDIKLVQHAGKGKNKGDKRGGKKSGKESSKKGKKNLDKDKADKIKKDEEERLKKWNEDWEKKLKAQEALDEVPCCSAKGLYLKPKTQSNIWIKVTQDRRIQDIQMAFMHVPVPRPKPPPLPKLVKVETKAEVSPSVVPKKKKGAGKKKGKGKK